jgi:hypothetical protein
MDYGNNCVGSVVRKKDSFICTFAGEKTETTTLPQIMQGIAPNASQFPAANDILEFYNMAKMDVWTYLERSNGIKSSRNVWFLAEPVDETWFPLVQGMHLKSRFDALFKEGDMLRVLMNGCIYVNRHTVDVLPRELIRPYLVRDGVTRFSMATGYVRALSPYPSTRGLVGRLVIDFTASEL